MAVQGPVDGPEPIMVGYLDKFSMTGLVKRWNRRWFVLYGPKSEAHVRLEYFDDEVSQLNESGRRVIPLRECRSCSQVTSMKSRPFVFQCTTHIGHHLFAATSQEEVDCWVRHVRAAVKTHLVSRQRKGSKQTSSSSVSSWTNAAFSPLPKGVVLQELVTVAPSDGAQKANLSGMYLLNIMAKGMALHDTSSHSRVAVWEFRTIKSYGKSHNDFNFETGRSSRYGVARFVLECSRSREVFRTVNDCIKSLAHTQTTRRSAPDLQKARNQRQLPARAQFMYETSTSEPQASNSSGATSPSRNTSRSSVYLENPLQQLRAIHSIDLPRSPSSGSSAVASPVSSTSPSGRDYSDHFEELESVVESPPSYQDALQLQASSKWDSIIKQSSTDSDVQELSALADSSVSQTDATPSGRHIFGTDPFSSFTANDHSFASSSPHTQQDSTKRRPLQDPFGQPRNRDSTEGFPLQDPFRQPSSRDSVEGFPLQDPFRQPSSRDSVEGLPLRDPFRQPSSRDSVEGFPLQDPFRQPSNRDSVEGLPLQDPFMQTRNRDSVEGFPLQDPWGSRPRNRESTEGFPLLDPFMQQLCPLTTSSPTNPVQGNPFEDLSTFLEEDQVQSFDEIDDSLFAQLALLDLQGTSPGDT